MHSPRILLITLMALSLALISTAAAPARAADDPEAFPILLNELENAGDPMRRGFDQMIQSFEQPGNRVVKMLGSADTWDAFGTPVLRAAVLNRWRKRWSAEGQEMLRGTHHPEKLPGVVSVDAMGMSFSEKVNDIRTPFFLNNSHITEMGTMDGAFPPMGFMLGDQSGVWTPPVKALDGFSFTLREAGQPAWALSDSQDFAHDFASARFRYAKREWRVERLDFPAAEQPALFARLTLENDSNEPRTLDVDFVARVNIRPDWRTAAQNKQQNDLDVIEAADGIVRAWDRNLPNSLIVIASDQAGARASVQDAAATLTCRTTIPAKGHSTLNFVILGRNENMNGDAAKHGLALAQRSDVSLVDQRKRMAERCAKGVRFQCSDTQLMESFALAKANLALLTVDSRPHFPDIYLMAGVPMYPRLFGCDSEISMPGVVAAGWREESRGTLGCLAAMARKSDSLVAHESASDATLIGPSNAQETTQFIATCWQYYQWTGDRVFLREMYPLFKAALAEQSKKFSKGGGYPNGPALAETSGMGPQRIDAACWLYAAEAALADTAHALDAQDDEQAYRAAADSLRAAIQRDWWMPEQRMWADSLSDSGKPRFDGVWTVLFPLPTGVASKEQVTLTVSGLQAGWVNQWGGVHTKEKDIRNQGSGVVTTNLFATAAFAHGYPDSGLSLLRQAAKAPRQERMPGGFVEMIPPGGSDFVQLWSAAPFLEAVITGLAGVRPDGAGHRADFMPRLPRGLNEYSLEDLHIGDHVLSLTMSRIGKSVVAKLRHTRGPSAFSGTLQPVEGSAPVAIRLNPGEEIMVSKP